MTRSSLVCALALLATPLLAQTAPLTAQVEPLGDEVTLAVGKTYSHELVAPKVAVLAQKEFLVTWDLNYMKYSGSQLIDWGSQISGRKVSLEGQPVGRGVDVVGGKAVQVHPAVAANAEARRFVVVWDNDRQISARLFDASGRKIGPVILVSTENDLQESFPHVAINAKGSFVVAWQARETSESAQEVRARFFNRDGVPQGSDFVVASGLQVYFNPVSSVALTDADTFLVAWESATLENFRSRINARLFGVQTP